MAEIRNFKCTYSNETGLSQELADSLGFAFPEAYLHASSMCDIALAIKRESGASYCMLPFCHTVEAESMGGKINYGDALVGPRAGEFAFGTVEDLLSLPDIDFAKGRISEVLEACRMLRQQDENVVLQISGPFSILNSLIDTRNIFKAFRKQPQEMNSVFSYIERNLLNFIVEALKGGVNLLSYADPAGAVSIIGPGRAEEIVRSFTHPFMKKVEKLIDGGAIMILCPGTTFALIDSEVAQWGALDLGETLAYSAACVRAVGKAKFTGETCMKNGNYVINNVLKTVILK